MPNKSHDDLSEMLNDLAESQKRQEAELHELSGGNANPPSVKVDDDEPFDAVLAEETTKIDTTSTPRSAADEVTVVEAQVEAVEPPAQAASDQQAHRPVDDLIALQQEDAAASADMLAELAQEAGTEGGEEQPVAVFEPEAAEAPTSFASSAAIPQSATRRSKPARVPPKPQANLKAVFAPVLLTFGILMLLPAVWAVMILMGAETWMHDGQGVDTMAKIMLICWPVGLGLLAGAFVSFVQLSREKAKQRQREAAMSRDR